MNWTDEDILRRNREVLGIGRVVGIDNVRMERDAHGEEVLKFTEYHSVGPVPPSDLKPEWMIEAECTKILEEDGWRALRTDPVSDRGRGKGFGTPGMADHLYIRYSPRCPLGTNPRQTAEVVWIEFKSAKGKPKSHQIDWHTKERARGALTLIAGVDFPPSIDGFKQWYRASGLQRGGV